MPKLKDIKKVLVSVRQQSLTMQAPRLAVL